MLAIFVGVRAEHHAADRHIQILDRRQLNNGYVLSRGTFRDNPVLVCRTGLGEERVKGIADEIIHEHPSPRSSQRGWPARSRRTCALAIWPSARTRMLHRSGEDIIHQPSGEVDRRLLELGGRAATSAGVPHVVGDCLTLAPLRPVSVNRELAGDVGNVVVVDTEGHWLAETAFEHQIPFLSVRVSPGEVYDSLPESLSMVGKRSYVSAWSTLRQNVAHPTRLPNFLRLVDAVRVSCRALSCFFGAFLAEWDQQPLRSHSADQR